MSYTSATKDQLNVTECIQEFKQFFFLLTNHTLYVGG